MFLRDICDADAPIIYGILQPGPEVAGGVPYVRPSEIVGDSIDLPNIKRTSTAIAERYKRSTLETGDLLISIVGTLGKLAIVPPELNDGNITQSSARIRLDKSKADLRYVKQVLSSSFASRQYDRHRLGTGVPRLNIHHVRDLLIPLPPLEEQRRIAAILDKADELRTKRREAIAKLDTLAQSIFIDMFGDPAKNPLDWSEVALGDITELLSGFAFKSAQFGDEIGLPVVRIRDVKRGYSETYFDGEYDPKYIIDDGDLLIGMDGEFNRETWSGGQALLNQRVCKLEADQNSLDQRYLHHFLPQALKEIERGTSFATVKHISAKQIRAIRIPLPPLETQLKFASLVKLVEQDTSRYKEQISRLNTLSSSLQQRAFKGEL